MSRLTQSLSRAVVIAFMTYLFPAGATFNGVVTPDLKMLTLAATTLLIITWLLVRWRRGWNWHHAALDKVLVLWVLAFGISLLANLEIWRRIAIGLWYVGTYIAVWYVLHDLLANNGVSRDTLVDGLLISGVIVLYIGCIQLYTWLAVRLPLINAELLPFELPRLGSIIGNPNALGGFLIVLVPLIQGRLLTLRNRLVKFVFAVYLALAVTFLFITESRGAWVGITVGMAVWGVLVLAQRQLLSRQGIGQWRQRLSQRQRAGLMIGGVLAVLMIAGTSVVFVRSFSEGGRETGWRTAIYGAAINLFLEKPLAGHGLFTFGRGLARLQSMPPETAHSHAHDIPLQVAAELGIIGLVALAATLYVLLRSIRHNWQAVTDRQQTVFASFIAAVVAFGVHQLIDIPAMMPTIALSGLVVLVLAAVPISSTPPQPLPPSLRGHSSPFESHGEGEKNKGIRLPNRLYTLAVAGLWAVLLASGFWSTSVYDGYAEAVSYGIQSGNYGEAAERLQPVIDSDPSLALYYLEQGELFGLAAYEGDLEAAQEGVAAYERFMVLEPNYAVAWANLGALRWQLGEQSEAVEAMQRAVELAPRSWELTFNLGMYLEEMGDIEAARQVYGQALDLRPCGPFYPEWETTVLRNEVLNSRHTTCLPDNLGSTVSGHVMNAVVMLETDRAAAEDELGMAARLVLYQQDLAWVHVGRARFARFDGDDITAESELEAARSLSQPGFLDIDYVEGINIAHSQYLRAAIQRLFLPQVYFPTSDPVLLEWIANT